jgi:hypothetical protein
VAFILVELEDVRSVADPWERSLAFNAPVALLIAAVILVVPALIGK